MLLIVVSGTRNDYPGLRELVREELDTVVELHPPSSPVLVMHGACGWDAGDTRSQLVVNLRGADAWAHRWALHHKPWVQPVPLAARWAKLGAPAGPDRNQDLCNVAAIYRVYGWNVQACAFPAGGPGTAGFIRSWSATMGTESLRIREAP